MTRGATLTWVGEFDTAAVFDHLHLERYTQCGTRWCYEDPLALLKDLVEVDTTAPLIPADSVFMVWDDWGQPEGESTVFGTMSALDPPRDVYVVFGRADVVALVKDSYRRGPNPTPVWHGLGVASVGYDVKRDGSMVVGPYARSFVDSVRGCDDASVAKSVYAVTNRFATEDNWEQHRLYYAVSNYHPSLGEGNWTSEARKGCWNTRMVQGGGLPWEAADAAHPDEAQYPDGAYTVTVTAGDYWDTTSASVPVIVDDFVPYGEG